MHWFWDNIRLKKEDRVGMSALITFLFIFLFFKWYLLFMHSPDSKQFRALELDEYDHFILDSISTFNKPQKPGYSFSKKKPIKIEGVSETAIVDNVIPTVNEKQILSFFTFDPNTVHEDSLRLLGFNQNVCRNLLRYRNAGGRIRTPEALLKIYGMDSLFYQKIEPYVSIKKKTANDTNSDKYKRYQKPFKKALALGEIDINVADTMTFKKLRGIGSVYANRIVKYRRSLGGFYSIDQINEVWGISDSLFLKIKPYLKIDISELQKKDINVMDKDNLAKHPYIDWKEAKIIAKFKKMHGDFESIDELYKLHGIDPGLVDTLKYYFAVK